MSNREVLTNYVYKMVASIMQNGVEDVVISPGSRSTPLAYAFASTKETIGLSSSRRALGCIFCVRY